MSQSNILLESGTNELEIVEFFVDEAEGYRACYGVNVAKVLEILREQPVTTMPEMKHPAVLGAFKYRNNNVLPLIDLGKYLGRDRVPAEDNKIIVTEFNEVVTAFAVSGVNRIHRLSWEQVEAPGKFLQAVSGSAITGVVRLENRVIFLLDLEMIVGDLDPGLAIRMASSFEVESGSSAYTVVHCDDSGSVRKLVKKLLEAGGQFEVKQFSDGREGWDYLEEMVQRAKAEGRPVTEFVQGVVTDIEMPRMDGHNLCKRIKADPDLKVLPVALFSSLITEKLEHKGHSVGADAQFAKPDLQRLGEYLRDLLKEKGL